MNLYQRLRNFEWDIKILIAVQTKYFWHSFSINSNGGFDVNTYFFFFFATKFT